MPTVADQVRTCIRRDPVLREGLARDILSHAKLARWLQATYGIPGTEHAVISALRRTDPMDDSSFSDRGREALEDVKIDIRDPIAVLTVDASPPFLDRLGRLRAREGDPLFLKMGAQTTTIAVPIASLEAALDALGRDIVEETDQDQALVVLEEKTGRSVDLDALWTFLHRRLSVEGITVGEHKVDEARCGFLIASADKPAVREHLLELREGYG